MNRRKTLKYFGLLSSIPFFNNKEPYWMEDFITTGILENKNLYLKEPIKITKEFKKEVIIRNCYIEAVKNFKDKSLIIVEDGILVSLFDCDFFINNNNISLVKVIIGNEYRNI